MIIIENYFQLKNRNNVTFDLGDTLTLSKIYFAECDQIYLLSPKQLDFNTEIILLHVLASDNLRGVQVSLVNLAHQKIPAKSYKIVSKGVGEKRE